MPTLTTWKQGGFKQNKTKKQKQQQQKNGFFKITCNFNGTKLARNREVAKFGCENGTKMFTK